MSERLDKDYLVNFLDDKMLIGKSVSIGVANILLNVIAECFNFRHNNNVCFENYFFENQHKCHVINIDFGLIKERVVKDFLCYSSFYAQIISAFKIKFSKKDLFICELKVSEDEITPYLIMNCDAMKDLKYEINPMQLNKCLIFFNDLLYCRKKFSYRISSKSFKYKTVPRKYLEDVGCE